MGIEKQCQKRGVGYLGGLSIQNGEPRSTGGDFSTKNRPNLHSQYVSCQVQIVLVRTWRGTGNYNCFQHWDFLRIPCEPIEHLVKTVVTLENILGQRWLQVFWLKLFQTAWLIRWRDCPLSLIENRQWQTITELNLTNQLWAKNKVVILRIYF